MKKTIILFSAIALSLSLITPTAISAVSTAAVGSANSAPIAQESEISTYKDISISGRVSAVDPDGDIITYTVSDEPERGSVIMEQDGRFTYTPQSGKKGKDSFCFIAVDDHGNVSPEAKVTVYVKKLSSDICYSDMEGQSAHYAALCLADKGIFIGRQVSGKYFFDPDETVSRGEFLVMCLDLCGIDKLTDITKTGFSDDEKISVWLKPYVAAGLMNGIIKGYNSDGSIIFSSDKPITLAEAAVTLNNALALTDVYYGNANDTCPVWAEQAWCNMQSCNIIPESGEYNEPLTRAAAAEMLVASIDILNNR